MLSLARKLRSAVAGRTARSRQEQYPNCVQGIVLDDEAVQDLNLDGHVMHVTEDGTLVMGDLDRALGCPEEVINSLPTKVVKDLGTIGNQSSCVVCQCDFEVQDTIKTLPCGHIFHNDCINQWLAVSRCCPLCEQSVQHYRAVSGS
mmetsp:Transcript_3162/g.7120  ORF Transcript_3162/g.7120 Transcript_3162/m.7120 type:complete len:146 (+) Transcript_3162:126-563(+)